MLRAGGIFFCAFAVCFFHQHDIKQTLKTILVCTDNSLWLWFIKVISELACSSQFIRNKCRNYSLYANRLNRSGGKNIVLKQQVYILQSCLSIFVSWVNRHSTSNSYRSGFRPNEHKSVIYRFVLFYLYGFRVILIIRTNNGMLFTKQRASNGLMAPTGKMNWNSCVKIIKAYRKTQTIWTVPQSV